MIVEYTIKELIKTSIGLVNKALTKKVDSINLDKESYLGKRDGSEREKLLRKMKGKQISANIDVKPDMSEELIKTHITKIKNWCSFIQFKELSGRKKLTDIYVHLNMYVVPSSRHISSIEKQNLISFGELISSVDSNLLLHGLPGAGKTTAMKKVMSDYLRENSKLAEDFRTPILVRLRDIQTQNSTKYPLSDLLMELMGCSFNFDVPDELQEISQDFLDDTMNASMKAFYRFIDKLEPLIILDGFDEVPNTHVKSLVLREVKELTESAEHLKVILTCRTREINNPIDGFVEYEIAPLSWPQIKEFTGKWIAEEAQGTDFLEQISDSPYYDTTMKPLSLAHLCAIFERTRSIPEKPKAVYKRTVRLLLDEWDEQRGIHRQSAYANFDTDQKFEFLSNLAYILSADIRKSVISKSNFDTIFHEISHRYKLKFEEKDNILNELESHTGLFVISGHEQLEFSHKSLQEFLAAEYIVKKPRPTFAPASIENMNSELAVAVAISSEPSAYLRMLIEDSFHNYKLSPDFYYSFINRLRQEQPDFEDLTETFFDSLTLLSAWYRNGDMKDIQRQNNLEPDDFLPGYDKNDALFTPPIKELFTEKFWRKMSVDLERRANVVSRQRFGKHDITILYLEDKKLFSRRKHHLCLPTDFIRNELSSTLWLKQELDSTLTNQGDLI